MCSNDESILYADDTVLVYVGTTLEKLTDHVILDYETYLVGATLTFYH